MEERRTVGRNVADQFTPFIHSRIQSVLRDEGLVDGLEVKVEEQDSRKGEHFMSIMYGVKGSGKTPQGRCVTIPFIAKVPVSNSTWRETYNTDQLFRKEMDFYNVILPAYLELKMTRGRQLEGYGEEDVTRGGLEYVPRCFCTVSEGMQSIILMEDLSEAGYRMEDRMKGLDLDKSLVVMRSLGKLHAFSYSMQQKDPLTFQYLMKLTQETYLIPEGSGNREEVYQENALSSVRVVKELHPDAAEKLAERLKEGTFKLMANSVSARDQYSVVNHGDMWINNLLFRRSGEGDWEVKFVDYQTVRYCSPAGDLSCFLMTSVGMATREKHFEDLLKEYHDSLVCWLGRLGCAFPQSTFPYEQIEDQMRKYAFFGIGMALVFLPLYYLDPRDSPDVEGLQDPSFGYLRKLHAAGIENPAARENLVSVIKLCCDRGYI